MKKRLRHENYATLKGRGLEGDKEYTLTIHKQSVLAGGFEHLSDYEKEMKKLVSEKIEQSTQPDDVERKKERFLNSVSRSKSAVIQLGANNPWEHFVSLTFSRQNENINAYDLEAVSKVLCKFFSNYRQRSAPDFRYLLIPEKHKDGAWHFHGFFMGVNPRDLFINKYGYLDFRPYAERFGYISFGRDRKNNEPALGDKCTAGKIRDLKKAAAYITKYITKDMLGDNGFETNAHLYFASRGLKRDEVVAVGASVYGANQFRDLDYEIFENEFCIKVKLDDLETGMKCIRPFEDLYRIGGYLPPVDDSPRARKAIARNWPTFKRSNHFLNKWGSLTFRFPDASDDELEIKAMLLKDIKAIFASAPPYFPTADYTQIEMGVSI